MLKSYQYWWTSSDMLAVYTPEQASMSHFTLTSSYFTVTSPAIITHGKHCSHFTDVYPCCSGPCPFKRLLSYQMPIGCTLWEFRHLLHPFCFLWSLLMFLQLLSLWSCLRLWRSCVQPSHFSQSSGACWSSKYMHLMFYPRLGHLVGCKVHFSRWTLVKLTLPSSNCSALLHHGGMHGCSDPTLLAP